MIERNNDKKEMYKTKVLRNSFISIAIGLFLLLLITQTSHINFSYAP